MAGTLPILPEHIYRSVTDPKHYTQPDALVGSGPYRLKRYSKAQGFYLLERNNHWYRGWPEYKEVIITRLSPQAAANAMAKGQVDIVNISFNYIDLFQQSGANIIQVPSNHPYRLVFNHQHRFRRVALRQGLAYLINRQHWRHWLTEGYVQVARPAFKQDGGNAGLHLYQHNEAKAMALLHQGGWTKMTPDDGLMSTESRLIYL
ncbi:ABC transporter substrate-binding protein [Vibrio sp. PP-XX7]